MKLEEYLTVVSQQIRCAKIRQSVTDELRDHILDQAEAYEEMGAFPEEALERAVREMGDPIDTGVSLDRIHRPRMNWGIVCMIALISIFSVGMFYFAGVNDLVQFSWHRQTFFVLLGIFLMFCVYRLDYSTLGKFGWKPAVLFLALLVFGWIFSSRAIYGARRWIYIGGLSISVSEAMLLYVPLFGAALYAFRGDGACIFLKVLPLLLFPVIFLWITPDLGSALILFACLFCVWIYAVAKGWYRIPKKMVCFLSGGTVLLTPLFLTGYLYFFGAAYQTARIRAFFDSDMTFYTGSMLYTDFVLVTMCEVYGIFLTIAVLAGLLLIIFKMFRISVTQKNQLGQILGISCGLVFLVKTAAGILMNLQLLPYLSINLPFLSYGGSSVIVSYILLGLILSIYRYQNILPSYSNHSGSDDRVPQL